MTLPEARPAPRLYTAAWILCGGGFIAIAFGLFIIGFEPALGGMLVLVGIAALLPGLVTAARYQLVARRTRPEERYRGPSPVILFFLQVAVVTAASVPIYFGGQAFAQSPGGFLAASVVLLGGYLFVVWLFVVRGGALSWREMVRVPRLTARRIAADIGIGAVTMFVGAFGAGLLGTLVSTLLGGTSPPQVVPPPTTTAEIVMVSLGAGILVPIGEELFFRGFSISAWWRDLGPRSALIRATVFFALVHLLNIQSATFIDGAKQAILEVSVIAPVGFALGYIYLRRGLIASIGGHATFNLFLLLVTVAFPSAT